MSFAIQSLAACLLGLLLVDPTAARRKDKVGDSEVLEAADGLERRHSLHGSDVIVHAGSAQSFGKSGGWIVDKRGGCTDEDLKQVIEHAKEFGVKAKWSSHPAKSGLCAIVLDGLEKAVLQLLEARGWAKDGTEIETDGEVVVDDPEAQNDETDAPSLLEANVIWNIDMLQGGRSDGAFDPPNFGKGSHIYILDTGIRTTHSDFGGRAKPGADYTVRPGGACNGDLTCAVDRQFHGTHVASSAAGSTYGVAKQATIHAVKVLGDSGSGSFSAIVSGLDWASDEDQAGPKVACMSLGARGVYQVMKTSVDRAVAAGLTVVVASGNSNSDACSFSPAFVPSAITVGAVDRNRAAARFSNYGRCVDLLAPGVSISGACQTSDRCTRSASGTSMAAPHVVGAAAIILDAQPDSSPRKVNEIIKTMALKGVVSSTRGAPNLLLYITDSIPGGPETSQAPTTTRAPPQTTQAPPPRTTQPPTPTPPAPPVCPWFCRLHSRMCFYQSCRGGCTYCGTD